jgi:hypothetical protein
MSTFERVTVTLPAELVAGIDRPKGTAARFIAEAVEHELARRRREALFDSVKNPHPETMDMADSGLGDWTAGLPDDEGSSILREGLPFAGWKDKGWLKASA